MKKLIILYLLLLLSIPLFAQLEVKEGSFKEVPGFVNINPDNNYQTDDNDLPFAVIKVRTENINDKQRRELKFSGNAGTFIMLEYKDGEVWVYLTAQYADYLKISHPDFSSIEFTLPYDLKPKCGYEMTLVNKAEVISNGWASLTITTSPENGADISLNGRPLNQTTPYTNNMIPAGKYEITVSKFGFENATKTIVINEGESTNFVIEIPYKYGKVSVVSNPTEAVVYLDDVEFGLTPIELNNIKYGTHELVVKKDNYTTYKNKFVVDNQELLSFSAILQKCPHDAINGGFSVSENIKIFFSKGNLQYNAAKNTWRFAEHQWDYIGEGNNNISQNYNGWIDLFGWGTSGYNGKYPYTWMLNDDTGFCDEKYGIAGTNYDWGVYNTINNSDSKKWRTLTADEWMYILNTRNTFSGIRYAKASVNGINGLIVLPDNWNGSNYSLNNINITNVNFDSNKISKKDWTTKFEDNGAVFLPAAGVISAGINHIGTLGCYWSSSCYDKDHSSIIWFDDEGLKAYDYHFFENGLSVRLVQDY